MRDEWYYSLDGAERGPVTAAGLADLVASGSLRLTDLAWDAVAGRGQRPAKRVIANLLEGPTEAETERVVSATVRGRLSGVGVSTGRWPDGCGAQHEAQYWSLAALTTQFVHDQPGVPEHSLFLSACYFDLGLLFQEASRFRQAEWAFGEALAVRERLAQSRPGNLDYQQALAASLNQLGLLFLDLGALARAEASIERAVAIRGQLARTFPDDRHVAVGLGGALCNLGSILGEQGRHSDSLTRHEAAISLLESQLAKIERTGWSAVWDWLSPRRRAASRALRSMAHTYLQNARAGRAQVLERLPR